MDAADVAAAPVHLINSGPSLAPFGAKAYAPAGPMRRLIVGDAGGTTFDVSVVRKGRIPRTRETWLGRPFMSHMTGMPSVDTKSIGAGGGSIAWIDEGGLLHVGPISAGAVPGPVGLWPGRFAPDRNGRGGCTRVHRSRTFSRRPDAPRPKGRGGGDRTRDRRYNRAEPRGRGCIDPRACQRAHGAGDPRGHTQSGDRSSVGRLCRRRRSRRPQLRRVGRRLGCRTVYVPETGAALAAAGALISDLTSHHQAMRHTTSEPSISMASMRCLNSSKGAAALRGVDREPRPSSLQSIGRPRPAIPIRPGRSRCRCVVRGSRIPRTSSVSSPISMRSIRIFSRSAIPSRRSKPLVGAQPFAVASARRAPDVLRQALRRASLARRVYFRPVGWADAAVLRFETLTPDSIVKGPAIVESGFTSVVIDPGAFARKDPSGCLVIEVAA